MEIGLYTVLTDETMLPGEAAKLIEDAGFDAISVGEHSHIPSSRETPYPGGDGELPQGYARTLDLFVVFTAAALATTHLRMESSIIQIAQRDPITTAKEAASVDYLSNGRLDLIAGHGWNVEELRNHGVEPAQRYEVVRERVLAIREIWGNDVATFHGEFVNFDAIWSWPKPVQPGGVPIILGGNSPGSEERALEYGDGWAPINAPGIVERVAAFTAANPGVPVHVAGVASEPKEIEAFAEAGTTRVILTWGLAYRGEAERSLEVLRRTVGLAVG
jgi:probable F420-dependent oxidoreductase